MTKIKRIGVLTSGVVAEGYKPGTQAVLEYLTRAGTNWDYACVSPCWVTCSAGGVPSATDRMFGTRLGCATVEGLLAGRSGVVTGLFGNQIAYTPLEEAVAELRPVDERLYETSRV